MKQPCSKCNSTTYKSFDELYIICVQCGTLKATDQPEPLPIPAGIECPHNQRSKIFEVNAAATAHMDKVIDHVRIMIADGKSWKIIADVLKFPCHHRTARRLYQNRITEGAISGRGALSAAIRDDFAAKATQIMEMRQAGFALRKIIATLGLKGAHSTLGRMIKEREVAA